MSKIYDIIIVGGGPAGLSAGLYGSRAKLDVLIIEKAKFGGQTTTTAELENYPGSIPDCTGPTLSVKECTNRQKSLEQNLLKMKLFQLIFQETSN